MNPTIFLPLFLLGIYCGPSGAEMEDLCLAAPRVAVNIYIVVRGDEADDMDVCDSRHFMRALKRRIYSDFRETSGGEMCHFRLDNYISCGNLPLGVVPRTTITFETNLICGDGCFKHTGGQTSIMEIDRQYDVINETMNINVLEIMEYNQTSIIIRYFYQEEGPVVYACKRDSYVQVFQKRNLTLCNCGEKCVEVPKKDDTFSFGEPEYSFFENIGTATIAVKKVNGSIDQAVTLTVSGFVQGELINQTITFGPNDTEIPITFEITDDVIPLEPTERFELSLNGTDTEYNLLFEPNDKTTINIVDDDGEHDEDVCLSTPTSEITIYVVVRGETHVEACDNQHRKNFLERTIHSDFSKISIDKCHLGPDYQVSCEPLSLGDIPRTAITIKVNMTCGSSCIQHTYRETSILEINRQEKAINEISILTVKKHRYNQTSDVIIRYFYGAKKPVFYSCENKEIGIIEGTNLTLCNCSEECGDPVRDVTFTFDKSVYTFVENMYNAIIHMKKTRGSIDRVITLLVTGFSQGPHTVDFYPQDTKKPINIQIFDNNNALEPTRKIELLLSPTDRISLIEPHEKATINILDDDELVIGLTIQKVTVMEGNNVTLCVNFSSEFVTNFNIDVSHLLTNLSTDNATSGEDTYLPGFSIEAISTLHGPDSNLCFDVSITKNKLLEYGECFVAVISLSNSVSGRLMVEIAGGKDMAVVCIDENNDRPAMTTEPAATSGPTVSTNTITSNQFGNTAVFVIAGIVLFLVAVLIVVVVIAMALRNCHITQRALTEDIPLDLQATGARPSEPNIYEEIL